MAKRDRDSPDYYDDEPTCGWGPFHPGWLQKFHNSICLVICLMLTNVVHGILMAGFVPASVSMWTKKFGLKNQQVATLQTCFEFASILGLIVVSHWGNLGHKGRWLGLGVVIYSVGALLYVIPQWASPAYDFAGSVSQAGPGPGGPGGPGGASAFCVIKSGNITCPDIAGGPPSGGPPPSGAPPGGAPPSGGPPGGGASSSEPEPEAESGGGMDVRNWFYLFAFASVLRGIGSSPAFVLGPTYLDENVSQKRSPILLGVMMSASGIGPLFGAALAAVCLKIYGDIGKISSSELDFILQQIDSDDPRWYGAWWIGFLAVGIMGFLFAIPILGFARKLPQADEERRNDVSQTLKTQASTASAKSVKELPIAIFNLCRNYVFLLLCLAQIFMSMMMSGIMLFGPRLLEDLFAISGSTAILVMGLTGVLPASAGMAIGGILIGKLKLKARGMLRYCAICSLLTTPLLAIYLLHCDPLPVAGVIAKGYDGMPLTPGAAKVLNNACNTNCSCQASGFQPVCDVATGISYYSPCHAGCVDEIKNPKNLLIPAKKWDNCSCLDHSQEFMNILIPNDREARQNFVLEKHEKMVKMDIKPDGIMVVTGMCTQSCWKFGLFIGLLVVKGAILGMSVPAMQQSQLRVVGIEQRTMALSFAWLVSRLLGIIPGQQIMGAIVDSACEYDGEKPPTPDPNNPPMGPDGCPMAAGGPGGGGGGGGGGGPPGPPGPSCVRYDIHKLAMTVTIYSVIVNLLATATYVVAAVVYKPEEDDEPPPPPPGDMNGEPPQKGMRLDRVGPGEEKPPRKF